MLNFDSEVAAIIINKVDVVIIRIMRVYVNISLIYLLLAYLNLVIEFFFPSFIPRRTVDRVRRF